jgi:muramoyltetrapeptide carboxypeptidase
MKMFADRHVKAILCVRGGYGTARLLPLLDYRVIRRNPKIFVGHSDITALHCALLTKANLISFHGPMLNSDFAKEDMPDFTRQSFLRTLSPGPSDNPSPVGRERVTEGRVREQREWRGAGGEGWTGNISAGYRGKTVRVLRRGLASGQLIGGNLTLLCTTIGTLWQPTFRDRILFLEDLGEQPYRFDRMLTHLLNCGLLQQVAGIAVGINRDCEDPKAKGEYCQSLDDVLKERLLPLKVPVVTGLPFGHVPFNATLPVGSRATLDANSGALILTEPAVR